jgi:N-dimethylarginine dimethylaminohydrolase
MEFLQLLKNIFVVPPNILFINWKTSLNSSYFFNLRLSFEMLFVFYDIFINVVKSVYSQGKTLHLKSALTMAGPEMVAIGQSSAGEGAWNAIEKHGKFKYTKLSLPEDKGANVLYINGTIVHQAASFVPGSVRILKSLNCRKVEVDMSEFAKADGCLSCCSLLLK